METTPSVEKIVEIELSRLKNENRLVLDDNLTPFSLRVRNDMSREDCLFDSPLKNELHGNTLEALNLELIEFPKFKTATDETNLDDKEDQEDSTDSSSDSSDVQLNNLGLDESPISQKTNYEERDLLKIFDSKIENADISLEEFPLYEFKGSNDKIIDAEVLIATPEVLKELEKINDNSTIAKRTRQKAKTSPIKKPASAFTLKKSKSKIPLPTTALQAGEIRRSKRLETHLFFDSPTRKVCSPNKSFRNLKPVLKIKSKNSLNLIVDSSTGQLHEATQYATEINANNGEGIPLPKTMNEQVTIPINGPRRSKIPKTAIVRGFMYKLPIPARHSDGAGAKVGFYSEDAYKKYFSPKASPSKVMKPSIESPTRKKVGSSKKGRSVRWAEQLEW